MRFPLGAVTTAPLVVVFASALAAASYGGGQALADGSCASRVRGDFDGDHRADVALVSSRHTDCRGRWRAVLRLRNGTSVARSLERDVRSGLEEDRGCQTSCRAFGAHDLDRDGRDELEIEAHPAATGAIVAPYRLVGRALHPLKLRGRPGTRAQLMELSYTGSVTGGTWVVCRDTRRGRWVVQVGEEYPTPVSHRVFVGERVFVLRGDFFRQVSTRRYWERSAAVGEPFPVRGRRC